jgi:hypothetical protein
LNKAIVVVDVRNYMSEIDLLIRARWRNTIDADDLVALDQGLAYNRLTDATAPPVTAIFIVWSYSEYTAWRKPLM